MQAIEVLAATGDEGLVLKNMPPMALGPMDIRISVIAAGVNRADLLQRRGHYPPPPGASLVLGLECSGTVSEVGALVRDHQVGDFVVALLAGGGYADSVVVPGSQAVSVTKFFSARHTAPLSPTAPGTMGYYGPSPLPPHGLVLSDIELLAALPEAMCTTWSNLVDTACLRAGETVLIHGGSGGVGSIAIQLAKAMDAQVITTAKGADRLAQCHALGADILIDHGTEDFVDAVATATQGHGADVILDVMGGSYLSRNISALAIGGRLVIIGLQGGRKADVDLSVLLSKRASLHGTTLRSMPVSHKSRIIQEMTRRCAPWVASGRVQPVVGAAFPLAKAGAAHRFLKSGETFGKVLLLRNPR